MTEPVDELKQKAIERFTLPRKWDQDLTIKCSDGDVCCSRVDLIRHSGYFRKRFEFEEKAGVASLDEIEEKETTMKTMLTILPIITPGEDQEECGTMLDCDKKTLEIAEYYVIPMMHTLIRATMLKWFDGDMIMDDDIDFLFYLSFSWFREQLIHDYDHRPSDLCVMFRVADQEGHTSIVKYCINELAIESTMMFDWDGDDIDVFNNLRSELKLVILNRSLSILAKDPKKNLSVSLDGNTELYVKNLRTIIESMPEVEIQIEEPKPKRQKI
jgi:hypothetical protein